MASNSNNFQFPNHPSPPPPQPLPPPDHHHNYIIIIVIPVMGCILFAIAVLGIFFHMKKKHKRRAVEETDVKHVDEHLRVEEAIVTDRHGHKKTMVLSVKDDVHVDEDIIRKEKEFNRVGDLEAGHGSSSGANVAKLENS